MVSTATDVVIVGGGPAGAVAALVLARAGRRVTVIEAAEEGAAPRVGEALPPAARPLFTDLGLLDRIRDGSHLPCPGNLSFWGSPEARQHDFLRDPHGTGWHLDRGEFDTALRAAAVEQGATVRKSTRVRTAARQKDSWHLTLGANRRGTGGGAEELSCAWLIDATGRGGGLAAAAGAERRRDDPLIALIARFRPTTGAPVDHDARTWIEAAPDGWWYSARLPQGERLVAFHTDPDLVDPAELRSCDGFLEHLRAAPRLGALLTAHGYRLTARPRGADAGSARLEPAAEEGWLAVGDAGLSLDPLSSQGLLTAAYTGLRGAEAVLTALAGEPHAVRRYWNRLHSIYAAYLEHRAHYYALETRWNDREFWRRRVRRSIGAREAMEPLLGKPLFDPGASAS